MYFFVTLICLLFTTWTKEKAWVQCPPDKVFSQQGLKCDLGYCSACKHCDVLNAPLERRTVQHSKSVHLFYKSK